MSDVAVNVKSCAVPDVFTNVCMNCTSAAPAWAHATPAANAAMTKCLSIETTCPPPRGGHGQPFPSGQPMLVLIPFPKHQPTGSPVDYRHYDPVQAARKE
jgi:hypothetical protein